MRRRAIDTALDMSRAVSIFKVVAGSRQSQMKCEAL